MYSIGKYSYFAENILGHSRVIFISIYIDSEKLYI